MNKAIRRTLQGAALAGGIVLVGSAAAQASNQIIDDVNVGDVNVASVSKTLNNNKVDVKVPVNAATAVVGDATAIQGGGHDIHKKSGLGGGNQIIDDINVGDVNVLSVSKTLNNNKIDVAVPVNAATTVVGDATAVQGGHGIMKKSGHGGNQIIDDIDLGDINVLSVSKSLNNNKINVFVPVNAATTVVGDALAVQG